MGLGMKNGIGILLTDIIYLVEFFLDQFIYFVLNTALLAIILALLKFLVFVFAG